MTATPAAAPRIRNHRQDDGGPCEGCAAGLPLTLADREAIHGRSFRGHDQSRDWHEVWCQACLAALPHGLGALTHVCEEP